MDKGFKIFSSCFYFYCPVPSMTVQECSGASDPKSETIHCRPYHLPAILAQRGHKVTGIIDCVRNAPPLGPPLPAGWKKWGMVRYVAHCADSNLHHITSYVQTPAELEWLTML